RIQAGFRRPIGRQQPCPECPGLTACRSRSPSRRHPAPGGKPHHSRIEDHPMKHPSLAPDQITLLGTADDVALATSEVIRRFHDAFDHHDPGAMKDLVSDDCVIENTNPAPDGARLVGKAACLANWQDLAKSTATWFIR